MSDFLLTFYGDDFTGSTDVTEALTWNGIPAALFLEPPDAGQVRQAFPQARAVGVAGVSRSLTADQMEAVLPAQFSALAALGAPCFHYKICSTFDSSPQIGSIGRAAEIGWREFSPSAVPVVVGAPILKRYVAFGNLFATVGGETIRLDRHPTMSRHPVTPMDEADLRLHLGRQTDRKIALLDWLTIQQGDSAVREAWNRLCADGAELILFDTLSEADLARIGGLLWALAQERPPSFVIGSSGVEYALAAHWNAIGLAHRSPPPESVGAVDRLIIVSGSAAPGTAAQIDWAEAHGFVCQRLDAPALVDPASADEALDQARAAALAAWEKGCSVLLYSARGPDDPALEATRTHLREMGIDPSSVSPLLGAQQGRLLRLLLQATGARRACVTGGDTCGHAARQLGVFALETILPIAPGAPLCRARSYEPRFDGLEISLKAGQVGRPDYFGSLLDGCRPV